MSYLSPDLVKVELRVSGVLPFALDAVWPVARQFGSLCFLRSYAGEPVDSALLPGCSECQVGAIRCVSLGSHKLIEQLTALDDTRHSLSYKLISHPLNSNPFPGSFVNFAATIRLLSVTLGNQAFCEMEASFYTEHEQGQEMHMRLEHMCLQQIHSLGAYLAAVSRPRAAIGQVVTGPVSRSGSRISQQQQQQQQAPPTKPMAETYPAKYSNPDSGGSTRGDLTALHASAQHSDQGHLHPNPHFATQQQQQQQQQPPTLDLQQQQQQLFPPSSLGEEVGFSPRDTSTHSSRRSQDLRSFTSTRDVSRRSAEQQQSAASPRASGAAMTTPFATALFPKADSPTQGNEQALSPQHYGHQLPPKSQSSMDGRTQRRMANELLTSMGGRAHYFAAEGGLPHTVIRDLQASGASTVSPGLLPLQPLGSADSFGTSPGGPIGTPHDNMDHGFSHELLSGSTGWQSLRNDSTDKQTPRTT